MGGEWPLVNLGDLIEVTTGFPFKSSQYSTNNKGFKLLRGDNVVQGTFRWENVKLWPKTELTDKHNAYWLQENDVILAMDRPWIEAGLKTSQIKKYDIPCLLVQRVASLRATEGLDQNYLRYVISSYWFVEYVKSVQTGTAVPHISPTQIKSFEFKLPSTQEQKAIAHILGSLDDKIEINRRMNTTLEAMAQALFKSWFVDFDPVIDKALAAGNPIPESFHKRAEARKALGKRRKPLPADIAQHFPDRFVFNEEMGWVPDGWEVETIGKVLELAYGKSLPAKKRIDGDIPVYGSGGISGSHNEKLVEGPGIIVGRKGTVGSLYWVEHAYFPIDTVFYVIRKLDLPLYWIYQSLQLIDIKSLGADSAVPGVNRNAIYAKFFTIPKDDIFKGYLNIIEKNIAKQKNIDLENGILIQLRDTLLPKLLSGQLRIPNAENFFKDA
ncbi:Type I restriction enzyme, S subunit [Candidatus Electrothrix aarhusensis]